MDIFVGFSSYNKTLDNISINCFSKDIKIKN